MQITFDVGEFRATGLFLLHSFVFSIWKPRVLSQSNILDNDGNMTLHSQEARSSEYSA